MRAHHQFTVFADYFQFIIQDEASQDDFGAIWTPAALAMGTAFGASAVCPGTLRNVDVKVEISIYEMEPLVDLSVFDHAVEGSIEVTTGVLAVLACTGYLPDAPRLKLPQGHYRVLAMMQGVETIKNEWEAADDLYSVYMWSGTVRPARLLKNWKNEA
jgi:hypothetical protein